MFKAVYKKNLLSFGIIAILGAALILFVVLFFISLAKNSRVKSEIAGNYKIINSYAKKTKMPISKSSILALKSERGKLKGLYDRFKSALESPLTEEILPEELDPLQFKEMLVQTQKKLRENAKMHNLMLPGSLGFSEYETELSEAAEIPGLIRRLNVLEELVGSMDLSGIKSLDKIEFLEDSVPSQKKDRLKKAKRAKRRKQAKKEESEKNKQKIYSIIPVSFTIQCANSKLVNFLYNLRISPFAFVIDDLTIIGMGHTEEGKETREASLQAEFSLKAIILN